MDIPELRAENRRVSDPANARRRASSASPAKQPQPKTKPKPQQQQQKQHLFPSGSRPPPPQDALRPRLRSLRSVEQRLNLRLRNELPCYVGTKWQIAQPPILRDILTSEEILPLLKEYQSKGMLSRSEDVESLCRKVRGHGHPSCIVVLAMLILVDKGHTIGEVLHDQVFDDNLPLVNVDHADPVLFSWDESRNDWRQLVCFEDDDTWGVQAKLDLCQWQWYLRTPRMNVSGPSFEAYEAKFGPETVLPWSSKSGDGDFMRHHRAKGYGGYNAVYKRHIDDRFHGFHEILEQIGLAGGRGFFALKVLNTYTPEEKAQISNLFQNERRQLSRFNGVVHNHLVTLLAAFEQENTDKNFFVFPWAECDLSTYWEKQQPGDVQWISEQLKGLVSALNEIHNPAQTSQTLGSTVFGRHGDLKPDNILWYTPYRGDPKGILVVSDMGFTTVNSELSRSKQTNGKPRLPTYRPPELDIQGANVTREHDIWSLGCIFLEMITWILGGQTLNNEFRTRRMTVEDGVKTSVFFTMVGGQPTVKQEVVQWFDTLRTHERSTEFTHAVLRIVQDKMITPRADRRSRVHELNYEFNRINEKCKKRASYYTPPMNTTATGTAHPFEPEDTTAESDRVIDTSGTTRIPKYIDPVESIDAPELPGARESTGTPKTTDVAGKSGSTKVSASQELGPITESTGVTESIEIFPGHSAYESGSTFLTVPTESAPNDKAVKDIGHGDGTTPDSAYTQAETQSLAYSNSNLSETTQEIYAQTFAARLLDKLSSDISSTESLEWVAEGLVENLKGFANRLGLKTKKQNQLDVVLFAHKHGSDIQKAFRTLLEDKKKEQTRVPQEEVTFSTNAWVETQGGPYDEPPPESPSIGPLLPIPAEIKDIQEFDNDVSDVRVAESHNQESSEDKAAFSRLIEYHEVVVETAAYTWLVETLRRDAILQPEEQNQMRAIRNKILQHLRTERISRTSPSKVFNVNFILDWNPWDFVQDREPPKRREQALLGAITFTGSPDNAQALMCSEYLTQTWPLNGKGLIQLLVNLMESDPGVECHGTLADGTEIKAMTKHDRTVIKVIGVADAVAEVSQQLAWIGAALRYAPDHFEQGLCECSSSITREEMQNENQDERTFELKFKVRGPVNPASTTGTCWHSMLRNPILVTGFPVRAKTVPEYGVEMPLDIMACLSGSHRVIEFDGKVVLKGFSTILFVAKQVDDFLIWHYTFNPDKSRIPFFKAKAPETDDIHLGLLETQRHIIGWCSSAKYYAGAPEADYDIEESGLPRPANGCILDRVSLSGGKFVSANLSLSLSNKNIPPQLTRHGYADMLRFLDQQFVILWDDKDKRGWLVNGTSALLHLARARMKDIDSGKWSSLYKFGSINLKEAEEKHHPTLSAAEVLQDDRNRELVVGKGRMESYIEKKATDTTDGSPSTLKKYGQLFEHFVEDDMSYLEQIIDHQLRLAGQNGVKIKTNVRRHLEGWDFVDLVNRSNPSPRMAVLDSLGWGWVDFVRSINAVTLFGRGFGDLIQPSEPESLCHKWQKLPTDRYCLAASATDLMTAMKAHGNRFTDPPQLVQSIYWHSPTACACEGAHTFNKKHIDPVQVLWPSALKRLRTIKTPTGLDKKETAAFVFGHNVSDPFGRVRWPDDGDKLPEIVKHTQGNLSEAPPMIIASSPENEQVITESFLQHTAQHREEQGNSQAADSSTTASYILGSSVQTDTISMSSIELPTPNMMTVPKVLSPDKDPEATIEDGQGSTVGPQQEAREHSETASQPAITSGPSEKREGVLGRLKRNFRTESQSRTTGPRLPMTSALGSFGWNLAQRRRNRNYHDSSTG